MAARSARFSSVCLGCLLLLSIFVPVTAQESASGPSGIAAKIVQLTNAARRERGLPDLVPVAYLEKAASSHSQEMVELNYFSHFSPTPGRRETKDRIRLSKGWDTRFGENIYRSRGVSSEDFAERAVKAWLASPPHYRNLMDPGFNSIGVGVSSKGGEYVVTQDFCYQTIIIENLTSSPTSGAYEIVFRGRVREGASEGALFVNNQFKGPFRADADGRFELREVVPAGAQVSVSQKKTNNKYAPNVSFPAGAVAP